MYTLVRRRGLPKVVGASQERKSHLTLFVFFFLSPLLETMAANKIICLGADSEYEYSIYGKFSSRHLRFLLLQLPGEKKSLEIVKLATKRRICIAFLPMIYTSEFSHINLFHSMRKKAHEKSCSSPWIIYAVPCARSDKRIIRESSLSHSSI